MNIFPRARVALFTDWESTWTTTEILPRMARELDEAVGSGIYPQVEKEQSKREYGKVPWLESYLATVEMFHGLSQERLEYLIGKSVILRDGSRELLEYLARRIPIKVMLTGGFENFVIPPFKEYYDRIIANRPVFDCNRRLSGVDVCVNGNKGDYVTEICRKYGIPMRKTIAVGDGAGDVGMIEAAGFGIAVRDAKPPLLEAVSRKGRDGYIMQTNNMVELVGVIERRLYEIEEIK